METKQIVSTKIIKEIIQIGGVLRTSLFRLEKKEPCQGVLSKIRKCLFYCNIPLFPSAVTFYFNAIFIGV